MRTSCQLAFVLALVSACGSTPRPVQVREQPRELDVTSQAEVPAVREAPQVIRLARPPFEHTVVRAATAGAGKPPKLVERTHAKNKITDVEEWFAKNGLSPAAHPLDPAAVHELTAHGFPAEVEGASMSAWLAHDDHDVVMYDSAEQHGRYLVVRRGEALLGPYDFAEYRDPPAVAKGEQDYTAMDTLWAEARGDVLYVVHAHMTYAKSSLGKNAYVSALALEDGALLWRSQPLVANARECVLLTGGLVCGYGFTAEPDYGYVLRLDDGRVASRVPLKSGPEHLRIKDSQLYVRTYDTDYVFRIEP